MAERDKRTYPDFFIVGAPRCGTTFMYEYLNRHPDIYMSPTKEPQYFATDLDSGSYLDSVTFMRDREQYLDLFKDAQPNQITGEASTWYLYSKDAARNIKAVNGDARIIIMLRDPVDMLYSLHGRRVYGGSEDLTDFEDALAAEDDRKLGRRIPPRARNVKALFYRDVGRYSEQVERYLEAFGPERVHIIIFEEFRADPASAYHQTLEFLGVDSAFKPDLRVVNEGVERRSVRAQRLRLAPVVVMLSRRAVPKRIRPHVGRVWDVVTTRTKRRPPLDRAVAEKLRKELHPDVARLSEIVGRDLTAIWR
jgi:hypothetical protein